MALRTLEDLRKIDEYIVVNSADPFGSHAPILVDHEKSILAFRLQDGPIKENGLNGCQVDTMIKVAKIIIEKLNCEFPCRENSVAITKLDEALMWLEKRKKDREERGVEGFNKS